MALPADGSGVRVTVRVSHGHRSWPLAVVNAITPFEPLAPGRHDADAPVELP